MNPVEIEQAVSDLVAQPFVAAEFPYALLEAFGNKSTTIKRLQRGGTNRSDVGGVLQTQNIHILTCAPGQVDAALATLKASPATRRARARFVLATDGIDIQAEDLQRDDFLTCAYTELSDHFGMLLPLAGFYVEVGVRGNSSVDIKATGRLNKLYGEIVKHNPEWGTQARSHDMNHFMARLIFCFFAESTGIFGGTGSFTRTLNQMSAPDASNTHEVLATLFRAMDTPTTVRDQANTPNWARAFPYVNGSLFAGADAVPRFNKPARTLLLAVGELDWTQINPDIFGSMIQAVADETERANLGMHYTSVPNILRVLNPLFLDGLRARLAAAGDNPRSLLNLRKRLARIRVFDPACGSGNFLVIAYKELRAIEAEINRRRGEPERTSDIRATNFRGIELRDFPAEIARLALVIAQYQCDVQYRGQQLALETFLPLSHDNWITCGNALRLDWLALCPPTGTAVKLRSDDLLETPLDQTEIDFDNEGGETYLCGNPPYLGSTWQDKAQKDDLKAIFAPYNANYKSLDYVAGWFMKAAEYGMHTPAAAAFVATNSICQGQQVPILWPLIFNTGHQIAFAHTSFKWKNLASHNAGVTVVVVGITQQPPAGRTLFVTGEKGAVTSHEVGFINGYLVPGADVVVAKRAAPPDGRASMSFGNKPVDGGHLLLSAHEVDALGLTDAQQARFVRQIYGSAEFIRGLSRYVLWIENEDLAEAQTIPAIAARIDAVRAMRLASKDPGAQAMATRAHQMREMHTGQSHAIVVAAISSENRPFLPCGLIDAQTTISNKMYALYDAPLWNLALIASRLHWVWIGTVCVRMRTDFSYSNTLGWNTFPIPFLTTPNKADLTRCAEDILLARERHYPATIAELYAPGKMPADLAYAHEQNDELIDRIYVGRRFKSDSDRLETLFRMYAEGTSGKQTSGKQTP